MKKKDENITGLCSPHAGEMVKARLKESGHTVVWLAEQLNCSRTNIYKIFERSSLNSDELLFLSQLLGYDFFKPFSQHLKKRKAAEKTGKAETPEEAV